MSRSAKESEDETEIKIGRRTRAIGNVSVVDSPLRRSTRNKQPVNQDDGSSPESIASDAAGPPARSTRRKINTVENTLSENTRSLRSRKNSTASDTTDIADNEASGDIRKRITRRSIAAISSVETPSKMRLRRSSRAGSETKTMSPSVRITRRSRASSVDLEENTEIPRDKSSLIPLGTPLKPRNRASVFPSEPSVIEESDNVPSEVPSSNRHDSENTNTSNNSSINTVISPNSRIQMDESDVNTQMEIDEVSVGELNTMKQHNNVCDSSSSNSPLTSLSKLKTNFGLSDKSLSQMDVPKIVLTKTDIPMQKSPGNKENQKTNIMISNENMNNMNTNAASHRKSTSFVNAKKIQEENRLNKSMDEHLLTTVDSQNTSIPPSDKLSEPLETSIHNKSLPQNDIVSVTISSKDESIIFLNEETDNNDYKQTIDDNSSEETIHVEPQEKSLLENTVQPSLKNLSVCEVDTTVDNLIDESSVNNSVTEIQTESIEAADVNQDSEAISFEKRRSPLNERKSTSRLSKNEKSPSKIDGNDKKNNIGDNEDIEANLENLFQDIPAEEWKATNNKSVIDKSTNADDATSGVINCQNVVFADKESWKIMQNNRATISRDTSDYDTDDTVILQNKNNLLEHSEVSHPSTIPEEPMDVDIDDDTETDLGNQSAEGKSRRKSHFKMRLSSENISNESSKTDKKAQQVDENASISMTCKSYDKNNSVSEKIQAIDKNTPEICQITKPIKNASRRSLNIISHESNENAKLRRRTIEAMNSSEFQVKNKESISSKDTAMSIDEDENSDSKMIEPSTKSPIDRKRRSLNRSLRAKTPTQNLINEETNENNTQSVLNVSNQKGKRKNSIELIKNNSSVETHSDSDSDENNSSANDENDKSNDMPEFLLNMSTSEDAADDDESASIDSDVAREFNLNGDVVSKYSDDDVPGDECRASETETSDDDDDNDMADFIVDDDEDIEEDEENESDDVENEINASEQNHKLHDNESNENQNNSRTCSQRKSRALESSSDNEETGTNESDAISTTDVSRKSLSQSHINDTSMDSSTPSIQRRSSVEISPEFLSDEPLTDSDTSNLNKSQNKNTSIHKSIELLESPTKVLNNSNVQNKSAQKQSTKINKNSNTPKIPKSKSLNDAPFNQSMQIKPTESPEVKMLMQEKLNASLPALKLQRRSLKVSRRSSLIDLKEDINEQDKELSEQSTIQEVEPINDKIEKKKKKKKIAAENFNEETIMNESTAAPITTERNIEKKKKKSNSIESEIASSDAKELKKKKASKQKINATDDIDIDMKKPRKKGLKQTSESNSDLASISENKYHDEICDIMKKKKTKVLKNELTKPTENTKPTIQSKKTNIKRLSEDILENLSDVQIRPKKRRKLDQQVVPSRTMFDSKNSQPSNLLIDDVKHISVSESGGTTQFDIVNLKKPTKKRSKATSAASNFRERMLARNKRQPVSAYLMYQQKLKASGKDKY